MLGDMYWRVATHQYLVWLDEGAGKRVEAIAHYREVLRCCEHLRSPDAEEVHRDLHT